MLRRGASCLLAIVALGLLTQAGAAQSPRPSDTTRRIDIEAKTIDAFHPNEPARRRFGHLEFRGGLELKSTDKSFGGLSALHVAADGRNFIAATDKAQWLRGEIRYDGVRPVGIADAEMAPMLDARGRPLAKRGWYDTEAIAADNGTLYVGIERVHRIVRFDFAKQGVAARAREVPGPSSVRRLPSNKSVEGLVYVPRNRTQGGKRRHPLAGTLIAFSERGIDAAGHRTAFLIGGPKPGTFGVIRHEDFDLSDAALLPDGNLLVLERRFNWNQGIAVRISRIPLEQLRPGAVVDGPVIFGADLRHQVDNMEGLAVHTSDGATVHTLISDDNFSAMQRTLLLQFTYRESVAGIR